MQTFGFDESAITRLGYPAKARRAQRNEHAHA